VPTVPAELVIAPEAESDIADACVWYEGRRAGLSEEFLSSVDACIESIRRRPEMYPIVHEGYRRSLVRRFPYAVFYEHSEATVTIYAVFHTSRDPAKWRQRLP
jgi:plasmid stabilization system protein ParE